MLPNGQRQSFITGSRRCNQSGSLCNSTARTSSWWMWNTQTLHDILKRRGEPGSVLPVHLVSPWPLWMRRMVQPGEELHGYRVPEWQRLQREVVFINTWSSQWDGRNTSVLLIVDRFSPADVASGSLLFILGLLFCCGPGSRSFSSCYQFSLSSPSCAIRPNSGTRPLAARHRGAMVQAVRGERGSGGGLRSMWRRRLPTFILCIGPIWGSAERL